MVPFTGVKGYIGSSSLLEFSHGLIVFDIDVFVPNGTPDPLHVHIIESSIFAIHADTNALRFKDRTKGLAGKLAPLLRIEDSWDSPLFDCFFKGGYAKLRIQGI